MEIGNFICGASGLAEARKRVVRGCLLRPILGDLRLKVFEQGHDLLERRHLRSGGMRCNEDSESQDSHWCWTGAPPASLWSAATKTVFFQGDYA